MSAFPGVLEKILIYDDRMNDLLWWDWNNEDRHLAGALYLCKDGVELAIDRTWELKHGAKVTLRMSDERVILAGMPIIVQVVSPSPFNFVTVCPTPERDGFSVGTYPAFRIDLRTFGDDATVFVGLEEIE